SYDTDQWLKNHPYFDVIVMGEGEQTFLELCQAYAEAKQTGEAPKLKEVAGIAYREEDRVRFSLPRAQLEDLNTIPSPFVDNLDELN
ncbi:hypothetical protein MXD81_22675, partial [Microbacteriaceae bacterium K1510]|nr:hypothetical protein [Microbacteriaceae bacterium K1510]